MSDWPGPHQPPDPSEEPTRVTPPPKPRESERATTLRRELTNPPVGQSATHLVALAVLEVSAAIDRLTLEIRRGREERPGEE